MELLLLGEMFDVAEAQRLGIINRAVPAQELIPTVRNVAAALAAKSLLAVQAIMECIQQTGDLTLEHGMDLEANRFGRLADTEDIIEGTKAFLEKRQAQFRGR